MGNTRKMEIVVNGDMDPQLKVVEWLVYGLPCNTGQYVKDVSIKFHNKGR